MWPDDEEAASFRIAQRLSISLQRANTRAIVKRLAETPRDEEMPAVPDGEEGDDLW